MEKIYDLVIEDHEVMSEQIILGTIGAGRSASTHHLCKDDFVVVDNTDKKTLNEIASEDKSFIINASPQIDYNPIVFVEPKNYLNGKRLPHKKHNKRK